MSTKPRWDVPEGWEWALAREVATVVGGGTPKSRDPSNFADTGIPWLTPADLSNFRETYVERGGRDLSEKGLRGSGARLLPAGTVLFTSRAPIGYCVIAANPVSTNQGFKSLVPANGIIPEFVRHYLRASRAYAESLASGTTFKELSGKRTEELAIPIPPTTEQRRIVAKVEALLTRSRRAKEALDTIPALLDRYRQSVLAAAFRGDLTADWRAQHPNVEPASELLGDTPTPLKERDKAGERGLQLPESWLWVRLAQTIDEGPTNGFSPRSGRDAGGTLSLKLTATTRGELNLSDDAVKRIYETVKPDSKYWLEPGDLLIQRANSLEYVGASAIFDGPSKTYIYPDLMMRVRIGHEGLRKWVWTYLDSRNARNYFQRNATGTAGNMPKINSAVVRGLPVPVPPESELKEVLNRLDDALSTAKRMLALVANGVGRLSMLNQSILAKAFRGELVPQDPSDEPASVLLARIKAERDTNGRTRRGRRRNATAEPVLPLAE